MEASEAVDLFLLPGIMAINYLLHSYITGTEIVAFDDSCNFLFSGLAFDKSGRRLGRGGGYVPKTSNSCGDMYLIKIACVFCKMQVK